MIHLPGQDESRISAQGTPNDSGFAPDGFKANTPMSTHADKIHPGQMLRIPQA